MAQAIGWRVTNQRQTEQYNSAGMFEHVVIVSFITDNGTTGSLPFPQAQYTPDNVAATINEFVARENAVHALGNK